MLRNLVLRSGVRQCLATASARNTFASLGPAVALSTKSFAHPRNVMYNTNKQTKLSIAVAPAYHPKRHFTPLVIPNAEANKTQWSSTTTLQESNDDWEMIYVGQLNNPHRYLKQFSLSSMVISLMAAPVIATFETDAVSKTGKLLLAMTTAVLGVSTTAFARFACASYVERVFLSKHDPAVFEVVRLDWRIRPYATRFDLNVDSFDDQVTRPLANVHHIQSGVCLMLQESVATHPLFSVMFPNEFVFDDQKDQTVVDENVKPTDQSSNVDKNTETVSSDTSTKKQ